jgi:predicted site-specific integrase-resolvase
MTTEQLRAQLESQGVHVPPSGLLRTAQVAIVLDLSAGTLAAWRRDGKPPSAVRINGQWFYGLDAIAALMNGES